jgi:hypothetical protein
MAAVFTRLWPMSGLAHGRTAVAQMRVSFATLVKLIEAFAPHGILFAIPSLKKKEMSGATHV